MTDYRDRWMEICLQEQLGDQRPPTAESILRAIEDQDADEVAGRAEPESGTVTRKSANGSRPRWPWVLVVAASLVGVGIISWLVLTPRVPHYGEGQMVGSLQARNGFLMPVSTQSVNLMGRPVLQDGWAYAYENSRQMQVGISVVDFQAARAVVRNGGVPNAYEAIAIAHQLRTSGLVQSSKELEMLSNPKKWFAGFGVSVCMFAGQVMLNQQTLQADETGAKEVLAQVFDRYDTNGSGELEVDECICKGSKHCDADGDGVVTKAEFAAGAKAHLGSINTFGNVVATVGGPDAFYAAAKSGELNNVMKQIANVSMDNVFAYLDKDGSGALEQSECICEGSKNSDHNSDGLVTQAEMQQTAVKFFGSEEAFLNTVRGKGGVERFFASVAEQENAANDKVTLKAVFAKYDQNGSGALEKPECICDATKMADINEDGSVSPKEFQQVALRIFGSVEKAEAHIAEFGTVDEFYNAVASGKIGRHPNMKH